MMHRGINLSHVSAGSDYQALADRGFEFAYIAVTTDQNEVDPAAAEHTWGCLEAGIKVGFYHKYIPTIGPTPDDYPEFFNFVHSHGLGNLPLALAVGVEDDDGWQKLAADTFEWLHSLESWNMGDHRAPLYGTDAQFADKMVEFGWPFGYHTWLANPGTKYNPLLRHEDGIELFMGDEDEWKAFVQP